MRRVKIATAMTLAGSVLAPAAGAADLAAQERYHPFQQGVEYRIEASQDDETHVLTGRAELRYTNNASGAIDRLYFHQYLNAFRPNSAWARYDLRFDNRTFQDLGPADHAFERITAFTVDGTTVRPVYPESPDSTVFYVELPAPLAPGASLTARIDWRARLATEPRRQGRRDRHYDWAHWYPRIAVYGADGWEYRPHIRPGELNGTFGTYDVTIDLPEDQVMGATGVPVQGEPGWAAVAVAASAPVQYLRDHYQRVDAPRLGLLAERPASGRKQVRWHAEDVHNFAWGTSPDYVYRGGRWNGTPIHLLWEPASEGWDDDRILREQIMALEWVEELFGEYAWPQITVTDRVEPGATEFPMLYMTSGGAVVHETMHMVAHGILASNEWREGWLDEGMASFLTNWLRESRGEDPEAVWGRARESIAQLDAAGRSEPVGLPGAEFSSYQMYATMTYTKGSLVLRMLRDMLGEDVFRRALREYYDRFRFRQVTGRDFQRVVEEVSGQELDWFFRQWLRTTDWLDYRIADVRVGGRAGAWQVTAEIQRRGDAWMPVVVEAGDERRTLTSRDRTQTVTFRLAERPAAVVLDPDGWLLETDRSNNRRAVPR